MALEEEGPTASAPEALPEAAAELDVTEEELPPVEAELAEQVEPQADPEQDWMALEEERPPAPAPEMEGAEAWMPLEEKEPEEEPAAADVTAPEKDLAEPPKETERPMVEAEPPRRPTWVSLEEEAEKEPTPEKELAVEPAVGAIETEIEPESKLEPEIELEDLEKAAQDSDQARLKLARSLWKANEKQRAFVEYEKLVSSPLLDTVIEDLEEIISEEPDQEPYLRLLGDAYMRDNQLDEALDMYRQALALL
jgi:tetratricopeptide (TPR) repeat protein